MASPYEHEKPGAPSPSSNAKGALGWNYVERVALQAGCRPIEVTIIDVGIDGYIEFSEEDGRTKVVALQVKCGTSYFDARGPRVYSDARHFGYWRLHSLPVLVVVVTPELDDAYWVDVRQHLAANPQSAADGPFVLRLPKTQKFDANTIGSTIRSCASWYDIADALDELVADDSEARVNSLKGFYRSRLDRRAVFAVAAALKTETDLEVLAALCDFFSRYFSHPEGSFAAPAEVRDYAATQVAGLHYKQLLRVLAAFSESDETGDWSGAEEFYNISEEEIWDRYSVVERATVQQGIAEVVRAVCAPTDLLAVLSDITADLRVRKSAVALFAYLDFSCSTERLDSANLEDADTALHALVDWLRLWLVREASEA